MEKKPSVTKPADLVAPDRKARTGSSNNQCGALADIVESTSDQSEQDFLPIVSNSDSDGDMETTTKASTKDTDLTKDQLITISQHSY